MSNTFVGNYAISKLYILQFPFIKCERWIRTLFHSIWLWCLWKIWIDKSIALVSSLID